jgi:hypothetical protein
VATKAFQPLLQKACSTGRRSVVWCGVAWCAKGLLDRAMCSQAKRGGQAHDRDRAVAIDLTFSPDVKPEPTSNRDTTPQRSSKPFSGSFSIYDHNNSSFKISDRNFNLFSNFDPNRSSSSPISSNNHINDLYSVNNINNNPFNSNRINNPFSNTSRHINPSPMRSTVGEMHSIQQKQREINAQYDTEREALEMEHEEMEEVMTLEVQDEAPELDDADLESLRDDNAREIADLEERRELKLQLLEDDVYEFRPSNITARFGLDAPAPMACVSPEVQSRRRSPRKTPPSPISPLSTSPRSPPRHRV